MKRETLTAAALSAILVSGCSSTPRNFAPELAAAPVDRIAYDQALAGCQQEAAQFGGKSSSDTLVSGAGTAVVGGSVAGGASWGAAAAAGAAAVVAVPVVGLVWGISRANRAKKEKRIKQAAGECLMAQGYTVASWKRIQRPRKAGQSEMEQEEVALVAQ